nr:MAG TPA: hypothetical protein [Caudoviricetes sp.]
MYIIFSSLKLFCNNAFNYIIDAIMCQNINICILNGKYVL